MRAIDNKAKILAVEDDKDLLFAIRHSLEKEGYRAFGADDGKSALSLVGKHRPDLFILDIGLPRMDGLACYEALRRKSPSPVIFLTGKAAEEDRVKGLRMGAEDYITKPFSFGELAARVQAVLRRAGRKPESPATGLLRAAEIELDAERREARVSGQAIDLTPKEFDFLKRLIEADGKVLGRDALLHEVWGVPEDAGMETRTVDQHVARLRHKLGAAGPRIVTVTGLGYRLRQD